MKTRWIWLVTVVATALFAACGTKSVDSLHPLVRTADLGKEKRVVILPFADYTPADTPASYWQRNFFVMEALQDEIFRYGYESAIRENVIAYLSDKDIIRQNAASPGIKNTAANAVLMAELKKEWSDSMRAELANALLSNLKNNYRNDDFRNEDDLVAESKSTALDAGTIMEIGKAFDAEYVIRGRIIVFKNGREDSFNPLQTGLLPFFFNAGHRAMFGIAESDRYEMIDKIAIGGILGAVIAPDDWPREGDSTSTSSVSGHPQFSSGLVTTVSQASESNFNTAIWGLAGSGVAYLAHKGGRVDNAVVQLRMMVQDAKTGKIIWTNRAEAKAMPESAFGKKDAETLTAEAIRHVCGRLVDNFVATNNSRRIVRQYDDGTFYVTPIGGAKPPSRELETVQVQSPAAVLKERTTYTPVSE